MKPHVVVRPTDRDRDARPPTGEPDKPRELTEDEFRKIVDVFDLLARWRDEDAEERQNGSGSSGMGTMGVPDSAPAATAGRKKPRRTGKCRAKSDPPAARPKDVIGFLLAVPFNPTSVEVSRLAHEFGITGPVDVKTYSAPDDNIHMDLIEGDPGYSVTRYPRDMEGCIGQLADQVLERFGGSVLAEPPGRSSSPATGLDAEAADDGFIQRTSSAPRSSPRETLRASRPR